MEDMAAHGEIKAAIQETKVEQALMLEIQSAREAGITGSRQVQVFVNDVDAQYVRLRKELGKAGRNLAGATAGIEDSGIQGKRVARINSDSCGQIARACASRQRTMDSSAICLAWGLRSVTAISPAGLGDHCWGRDVL